jgi:hypothetical protein
MHTHTAGRKGGRAGRETNVSSLSGIAGGNAQWYSHCGKYWQFFINLNIHITCNSSNGFLVCFIKLKRLI